MAFSCKTLKLNQPLRKVELTYFGADRINPAELENVRNQAIIEGKQQAEEVHNAQILEFREELRVLHDEVLGSIQNEFSSFKEAVAETLPRLAVQLLKKTLPTVEIDAEAIRKNISDLARQYSGDDEDLVAEVAPEDFQLVCKAAGAKGEAEHITEGNIRIISSDTLSRGDCVLKTKFGLIDATVGTKVKHIELALLGE